MFTDRATSKLRDIFDVAFKAKEDRPNGLQGPRVISISPDKIDKANPTTITVTGSGFDNTLIIKIDGAPVAVSASNIKPSTIVFSYSVPAAKAGATQFALDILDKNNAVLFSKTLGVL